MGSYESVETADEPKTKHRGFKAMPFLIGNEAFEKLGTLGSSANLLVYLTTVFNLSNVAATNYVNVFTGCTNFATLIGAFLSDTFFGRYNTIAFASVASILGLLVMTLTAAVQKLHPPYCGTSGAGTCIGPTAGQIAFLLCGFGLLTIGAGGIRPCNLAFGADQFNPETESGKRGISSFFNWYYFTYTFAMMISLTVIIYVQSEVSWSLGFAIPTLLMLLSLVVFLLGTRIYVKVKPEGSPLKSMVQVIVAAVKKRKLELPEQPSLTFFNHIPANSINAKLPHTDKFRYLGKGAILTPEDRINSDGSAANPWRLSSMQKVEEVKCVMRLIPIWIAAIFHFLFLNQQSTFVVFQALQSDRRLGSTFITIPASSYTIFSLITLTIWIPLYDRIFVPLLRRFTGKEGGISLLKRIGIGMVISVITLTVAGLVEERRRSLAVTKATAGTDAGTAAISSLSGMWLVPQLLLAGLADGFASIGAIEFFYQQLPENMSSFAGALLYSGGAVSHYLSSFLISIVHQTTDGTGSGGWLPEDLNKGRLDYFYYLVAALGTLNLLYFIVCSKRFKYKLKS